MTYVTIQNLIKYGDPLIDHILSYGKLLMPYSFDFVNHFSKKAIFVLIW